MSLQFNGTTQYADTGTKPSTVLNDFTLMCWVFVKSTSEQGTMVNNGTTSGGWGFGVGDTTTSGAGNNFVGIYGGVAWLASNTAIGTGWRHLALVRRAGTTFFYIDGRESPTTSATAPETPVGNFVVGAANTDLPRYYNDKIAHVRVFEIGLTRTQVISEMNSYRPINTQNLKMWLPMDEGTGTTLKDFSGKYTASLATTGGANWAPNPPISHN